MNLPMLTFETKNVFSPSSLSYNLLATLPSNENKSTFINNFLAYISSDSTNESSCSIDAEPIKNPKLLSIDYGDQINPTESSFITPTERNLNPFNKKTEVRRQSDPTNNCSQAFNLLKITTENENVHFFKIPKRDPLPNKLDESIYESQEQLDVAADKSGSNSTSGDALGYDSLTEMVIVPDAKCRKKSLPNITFRNHNHRPSMEVFQPYMIKKRISLGQVKVR